MIPYRMYFVYKSFLTLWDEMFSELPYRNINDVFPKKKKPKYDKINEENIIAKELSYAPLNN